MRFTYETDKLLIRTCNKKDAKLVHDFYVRNLDDFSMYEPIDKKSAVTMSYFRKLMEVENELILDKKLLRYYIFEKTNPFKVIGTVSFRDFELSVHVLTCRTGYKMDVNYRRRGYAKEVLGLLCDEVFNDIEMHRIEATVMPENKASIALLEGLGFEKEGLLKKYVELNGVWRDHYLYALVNENI